jgi:hypothetical protein
MTQLYEMRLVAYLDILGWSDACKVEFERLATAAQLIHDAANDYSTITKKEIERIADETGAEPNPMYMAVQAGAFSDNYVLSMPVEFGFRILSAASALAIKLLQLGFLTAGRSLRQFHDEVWHIPAIESAIEAELEKCTARREHRRGVVAHVGTGGGARDRHRGAERDAFLPAVHVAAAIGLAGAAGMQRAYRERLGLALLPGQVARRHDPRSVSDRSRQINPRLSACRRWIRCPAGWPGSGAPPPSPSSESH